MKPLTCAPTASPWTSPRGLLRDLLVQPEAAVGALAQTFDLPKREISNRLTPLRPHGDSPIPKRSETRRAAWATDEAEQLRPNEEHEHYAGHRQPDSPGAEDWFKQVHRHPYAADDVANAQKPVPGLVLSGSEVLTQRHENALCLRAWLGSSKLTWQRAIHRLIDAFAEAGGLTACIRHRIVKSDVAVRALVDTVEHALVGPKGSVSNRLGAVWARRAVKAPI